MASNSMSAEIENEISALHKYIVDLYSKKFPELESLVLNPLDYIRVVQRIGNTMVESMLNFPSILLVLLPLSFFCQCFSQLSTNHH